MPELNLKVGDRVVVSRGFSLPDVVKSVSKVTPKGSYRIEGFESILFDKFGRECGGDIWHVHSIYPATGEDIDRIKKERFIRTTMDLCHHLTSLTFEQAVEIYKVLKNSDK